MDKFKTKKFALLLVTYNRKELLRHILESISNFGWEYQSFIVVDNCSDDETPSILEEFLDQLSMIVLRTKENLGHGAGLALAMEYLDKSEAKPDYLIFLEDDSIPSKELPNGLISSISGTDFSLLSTLGSNTTLGKRTLIFPSNGKIEEVDFAVFDGAIMKYEVVSKVGLPVRDWFMMVDDYEYCYRIKKAGFKIGVVHNDFHQILHLGAGNGFVKSSLWRGYYQERNYVLFVKAHFSLFNLLDFLIFFAKRVGGSFSAPDRSLRIKFKFIGLWDGIRNKKGRTLDPGTLKFIS